MAVTVHIERLVVEGVRLGRHEAGLFRAAVEAELGRLLAGGDYADRAASVAVPAVRGEGVAWSRSERSEALGERVGRAVYGGLGP
jgi:hypothetical protein